VLDFVLLFLLVAVWKPIVLLLIYLELFVRISLLSVWLTLQTVSFTTCSPRALVQYVIVRSGLFSHFLTMCFGMSLLHQSAAQAHPLALSLEDLWECWSCVASLSLLMKFFSHKPKIGELRKHKKLAKLSLVYRVFRHII
jgi:hypothetical protein